MDRFLQEVSDEAHVWMLMHREVRIVEHPRALFLNKGREGINDLQAG
jgi:hypothetical protein